MASPIERLANLAIGTVESVSPDQIYVVLDVDAPQAVALNSGTPAAFPRINGYVLIPNESGAVVGLVVFLGVERSPFPRRQGFKDFGLIDLPFPLRKLHVTPLGTLRQQTERDASRRQRYSLERGVIAFPSVGDTVLLPTPGQLRAIVEAEGANRRVCIGTAPLAANASVYVDPDKLFGRHLAVLGNTGSGKSCSLAGLIRWSLEAARDARPKKDERPVHARFIVLDPNGEYLSTFRDFSPRVFQVPPATGARPLRVPAWMWNSLEWTAFAQAGPRVQRPLLLEALRTIRSGTPLAATAEQRLGRLFRGWRDLLASFLSKGPGSYAAFPQNKNILTIYGHISAEASRYTGSATAATQPNLQEIEKVCQEVIARSSYQSKTGLGANPLGEADLTEPIQAIDELLAVLPVQAITSTRSEDSPAPFNVDELAAWVESLAAIEVAGNEQYTANLVWRIRSLLADSRLRDIIGNNPPVDLSDWLAELIGTDGTDGQISVIDLSLVPSEIIHIVIAVVTRLVFEAVQRYRRQHGVELPTVLVLEEAHTFIHRGGTQGHDEADVLSPAQLCRSTFERVAREGRKFGLGLLLSSQRPSELSPTVLAQCNTFLLHRLVNDQDQELVGRLVPDNVRGILRELPSLPAAQAILLGWAVAVPILVEIKHLPKEQQPHSSDPDFWRVWTRSDERPVTWAPIVDDWTK